MTKKKYYPWVFLIAASFLYFSGSAALAQFPPLAVKLMTQFNMDYAGFMAVYSASMLPSLFLSAAAGVLMDKYGMRMITIGGIITILGGIGRAFATSQWMLTVSMVALGVCAAIMTANISKLLAAYFAPNKIGPMVGIMLAISTAGQTIATLTASIFKTVDAAFVVAAVVIAISVVVWIIVCPKEKRASDHSEAPKIPAANNSLKQMLRSKNVWLAAVIMSCNMCAFMVMTSSLPVALASMGMGDITAGVYNAIRTGASIVGALLLPAIAAKLNKNKLYLIICFVITGVGTIWGWKVPEGVPLVLALAIPSIAMSGASALLFSIPMYLPDVGFAYAGTAGGIIATVQTAASIIIPSYVLAPLAGDNIGLMFTIGGFFMAVAIVAILFLPKLEPQTHTVNVESDEQQIKQPGIQSIV